MPEVTIDVPPEYDKKVILLKAQRGIRTKKNMIETIVQEYFQNQEKSQ